MKNPLIDLLKSYEFNSSIEFFQSLAPSLKYQCTILLFSISAIATFLQQITGLQAMALVGFVVIMLAELITGIKASAVQSGAFNFNTKRFSRFVFKLFSYLAVFFFCQSMSVNYDHAGKMLAAETFSWIHTYLVVHIGGENILSVMENIAVIEGKPKAFYLEKLRDRLSIFK